MYLRISPNHTQFQRHMKQEKNTRQIRNIFKTFDEDEMNGGTKRKKKKHARMNNQSVIYER